MRLLQLEFGFHQPSIAHMFING